jgi:anti-anti-sigma factor
MGFKTSLDSKRATVFLDGRLAFGSYADFKAASVPLLDAPEVTEIHLDMSAVEYLDSSALGMILHFKQKTETAGKALAITHPSPPVAAVLKVVNFSKLMTILP